MDRMQRMTIWTLITFRNGTADGWTSADSLPALRQWVMDVIPDVAAALPVASSRSRYEFEVGKYKCLLIQGSLWYENVS